MNAAGNTIRAAAIMIPPVTGLKKRGKRLSACILRSGGATESNDGKMAVLRRGTEKGDSCSDTMLAIMQLRENHITPDSPEWAGIITRGKRSENSDEEVSKAAFEALTQLYRGTLRDDNGSYLYKADNKNISHCWNRRQINGQMHKSTCSIITGRIMTWIKHCLICKRP